ncbi:MAG: PAS domain-containing protein, partial [Synergistaceae bacterium]|nr:PAS domain-containing protein [Synergistaceae bacterium]
SKWKIYQCKEGYKQPIISSSLYLLRNEKRSGYKLEQNIIPQVSVRLEKLLAGVLSAVSPPSILLDEQDNIVQVVNDVSNHINIQPGQFSNSLKSNMNREQVLFINNLLRRIRKDRKDVMISNVMDFSRGGKSITLKGKLVEISKNDFCLISFIEQEENPIEEKSIEINMSEEVRERVKQLEGELQIAKEGLQATIEELETSNEELHSSNEELIASNEELQSTNEELQSVNEELYTVNNEHQLKIEELIRLNNDLNNLIKNTEVGALYLDIRLTIRKLTPVVTQITNIMESDIGRPISHFSMIEDYPGLIDDIIGVLETLIPVERQICIKDDKYYSIRIRPYRTEINSVEGIIVTFVEITSLKIEEKNSQSSTRRLKNAMELGNMAWWEYEVGHDIFRYSERITSMLGYAPRELPNDIAGVLKLVHCDDYENTSKIMLSYKTRDYQKWDIIYRMRKKDGAYVWFHDKGDILEQNGNNPIRILGTIIDITQYKNMEGKIKVFEHK